MGVLSCFDQTYQMIKNEGILKTWGSKSYSDVEIVFYYGKPGIDSYQEGGDVFVDANDNYTGIFKKTIVFFEYILKHKQFDFLFRPNISAYIDVELYKEYLKDKAPINFASGNCILKWHAEQEENKKYYLTGCGFTFSRDVVERVVKYCKDNPEYYNNPGLPGNEDDVIISKILHSLNVPLIEAVNNNNYSHRYDICDSRYGVSSDSISNLQSTYLIRCKAWMSPTRDDQVIMNNIFKAKKEAGFLT